MALRLVRQTSETPNITNKDDTIMTRYAYGGYNGIVKAFGQECNYTAENGIFKVLDGRIVIDGWEIEIDGAGWNLNLSSVTGTQYHSVYAEINVATESVKIDSTYFTGSYPEIEKGDDLTQIPNGTARLLLYNVKVENGIITEVNKKFDTIPYWSQRIGGRIYKDENGVFRIDNDVISRKRLLFNGSVNIAQLSTQNPVPIYTYENNLLGKTLEVEFSTSQDGGATWEKRQYSKIKIIKLLTINTIYCESLFYNKGILTSRIGIGVDVNSKTLLGYASKSHTYLSGGGSFDVELKNKEEVWSDVYITKVWEILE